MRVRVLWITLFRTVATTLILVVLAARIVFRDRDSAAGELTSFVVIGTVYFLTLVTGLLLRRGRVGAGAAWLQVVFDVILATAIVFLTGGLESPFSFTFLLAIIGSSALLALRGALVSAGLAVVGFAVSSVVPVLTRGSARSGSELALEVAIQVLAQLLMAALAGYLAEQLSRTGGQLSAREADFQRLTELQNRIVAVMPSGLVVCDEHRKITFANPAALAILSGNGALEGLDLDRVFPGLAQLRVGRRAELQVTTPRGELALGLSVVSLDRQTGALLVVFQDLTELRRLEHELAHLDRLADLGKVSAQLAHEIRNPLASIRGSGQLMGSQTPPGSPQERLAKVIVKEADRLASLVDNYLRLARPATPQCAPVRLDVITAETVEMLHADPVFARVPIEQSLEVAQANVDAGQIKQVLLNLLRNAVAATGPTGPVKVTVRQDREAALLEVWDGAGAVAPDDLPRLFEPFFTRREGGTGLGLSMVQSIVHSHGGTISVTSSPDRGTAFVVKLPVARNGP